MKDLSNKSFSITPDYTKRVYGLDIMRAVAISVVLFSHASVFLRSYFSQAYYPFVLAGYIGVEIFFVLSGFLIGTILIKIYERSDSFTPKVIAGFWTRRWFRTLPAYYLILIVNIVIAYFFLSPAGHFTYNKNFNLYFIFMQGFAHRNVPGFNEAWSLAIEEWFYLLVPILMLLVTLLLGRFISKKAVILTTIIVFIIVITGIRINYAWQNPMAGWEADIHMVVIYRLDAIMYGVLGAFICYYYNSTWNRLTNFAKYAGIILLAAGFVLFELTVQRREKSFFADTFLFSLFSLGFALFLPLANSVTLKHKPGNLPKIITHLSLISYSVYLINYSVIFKPLSRLFRPTHFITGMSVYILGLVIIIMASTLLYKYYEKPMTDLRDKVVTSKKLKPAITSKN